MEAKRQEEVKGGSREVIREGDGSRGGADAARNVRGAKTGSSVCTSKPSSLLSSLPFVPYLAGNRLERNRLVLAPRVGRTARSLVPSGIPREKFPRTRERLKKGLSRGERTSGATNGIRMRVNEISVIM